MPAVTEALDLFRGWPPSVLSLCPTLRARWFFKLVGIPSQATLRTPFLPSEALSVYTALVSADHDRYRVGYEQAIQSLTQHLKALGRTEQQIADELDRLAPEGDSQRRNPPT